MPKRASDPELKAEFSARIKEILKSKSTREIALALEVSVQNIYYYRDGRIAPSPEVIRRAMEAWGIELSYRGRTLSLHDYGKKAWMRAAPLQYELWDAIKKIDAKSVNIEVLDKQSASFQLGVRIAFTKR